MFKVAFIASSLVLGCFAATGSVGSAAQLTLEAPRATACFAVSLDQAIAMVTAKYRARVNRATTVQEGGRVVHEIRLMTADGSRVWTVRVDAESGREI